VLAAHPNLVVNAHAVQAGHGRLRVGFTISAPAIAAVLEKLRPPYNLSALRSARAEFSARARVRVVRRARAAEVVTERTRPPPRSPPAASRCFPAKRPPAHPYHRRHCAVQRLMDAASPCACSTPAGLAGCLRITVRHPAETAALLAAL